MRRFINCKINPDKFFNCSLTILWLLCAAVPARAQSPEITEASNVENCRFLDRIEGESGYGKNIDWKGLAKQSALSRAEKINASHIVWERFYPVGGFNGVAIASAYQCNPLNL